MASFGLYPLKHFFVAPKGKKVACHDFIYAGEPARSDRYYFEVGTDGCFERLKAINESLRLRLECPTLNLLYNPAINLSPAFPRPAVSWMFNGTLVYDGKTLSEDFLMKEDELLMETFFSPPIVTTINNGHSLEFTFQPTDNLTLLEIFKLNVIPDKVYNFLVGSWTCMQTNIYGNASATTTLSQCG